MFVTFKNDVQFGCKCKLFDMILYLNAGYYELRLHVSLNLTSLSKVITSMSTLIMSRILVKSF